MVRGAVFDVVVDIRPASPTFGQWFGLELNEYDNRQLWVPPGLAHGFLALGASVDSQYKATDYYAPELERCIAWDDPDLAINWPLEGAPTLSSRDSAGQAFIGAELRVAASPSRP